MFVVLSGRVKIFLSDSEGHEMILDMQGPGEYVGEMALDGKPRSASVMTMEPTAFSVVGRDPIREAIRHNPDFALDMISKIIDRARLATNSVKDLALLDVYGRVARLLLNMAVEHDGKLAIPEKLTQQEIAERVGASRDMVSRIFRDRTAAAISRSEPHDHHHQEASRPLVVGGLFGISPTTFPSFPCRGRVAFGSSLAHRRKRARAKCWKIPESTTPHPRNRNKRGWPPTLSRFCCTWWCSPLAMAIGVSGSTSSSRRRRVPRRCPPRALTPPPRRVERAGRPLQHVSRCSGLFLARSLPAAVS